MADFWDTFTTRIGDALVMPQAPWGQLMPGMPTPDRGTQIGNTLLSLGGALSAGARQRLPLGESLATGMQAAQAGGAQRQMMQLKMGLIGGQLQEAQRKNQTREMLGKIKAPEGIPQEVWSGIVATDPAAAFKVYTESLTRQRGLADFDRIYGGGGAPGGPGGDEIGRTAGLESPTGAPNAAGSGATGYLQWMPHTAHSIARQTPWGRSLTPDQVIAAINDEVKQTGGQGPGPKEREMKGIYDATSNGALSSAGLPTSASNRYILHRYGPAAGVELLRADPNMPLGQWVQSVKWDNGASPQAVISQNRLDPNMTVGEHRAQLTQMMAPGGVTRPPSRTVPQAPQEGDDGASSVQPAQYTPQAQGAPRTPAGQQQPVQIDPGIPPRVLANARLFAASGKMDDAQRLLAPYLGPEAANKPLVYDRRSQQWVVNDALLEQERRRSMVTAPPQTVMRDGQPVLVPGSDAFGQTPASAAAEQDRLAMEKRAKQVSEANQGVLVSPTGERTINEQEVEARRRVAAAQGVDAAGVARDTDLIKGINEVGKGRLDESLKKASAAAQSIPIFNEGRKLLDSGMITGTGAEWRVAMGNALATVGFNEGDALANTRAYLTLVGRNIGALAREVGGTQISNFDAKTAERLAAGDINIDEKSLRSMLAAGDKLARYHITAHGKLIDPLLNDKRIDATAGSLLRVEAPPEYTAPPKPPAPAPVPTTPGAEPQAPSRPAQNYRFDGKKLHTVP